MTKEEKGEERKGLQKRQYKKREVGGAIRGGEDPRQDHGHFTAALKVWPESRIRFFVTYALRPFYCSSRSMAPMSYLI